MLDRTIQPAFVQNKLFQLLTPEIQLLPNGAKVVHVHGGDQEIIKCEFVFSAGKWYESMPGIAHFTANLLPKGTSSCTSIQISKQLDFYGAHLDVQPGFDFTTITLYSHSKKILHVFDLLIDIISNPSFPQNEIDQAKRIFLQGLKINLEKTSFVASREFRKKLFGHKHPYGYDIEVDNVAQINREHLVEFHNKQFNDFTVFVSGKIDDLTIGAIGDKLSVLNFQKTNTVDQAIIPSKQFDYRIEKKDAIQTSLRIGKQTQGRSHPDYPGILLTSHILGGFFGSRLMKNIREEKGLTYGIHSTVQAIQHACFFSITADVKKESLDIAIEEIKNEIFKLKENPISPSELEVVRNHFVGSLQTELSTPFAHADKIKLITLFDLPISYYQQLIDSLFTISNYQVVDYTNKYFSEDQMYTITIG